MKDESSSYDNASIRERIKSGEFKVVAKRSRSRVWNVFSRVVDQNGTEINNVICRTCPSVFKFHGSTSNLVRHKCYKNAIGDLDSNESPKEVKVKYWGRESRDDQEYNADITDPLDEQNDSSLISLDSETKGRLALILTEWTVNSCRPLDILQDCGLRNLAKYFMEIGANFGSQVKVEELLPQPITISTHINRCYYEEMDKLRLEVSEARGNGYSITCSTWPDSHMKSTHLCLTMHYVKDSTLVNRLLSFSSLGVLDCTGSLLKETIEEKLSQFGCDLSGDKPIFVSAVESNLNESSLGVEVVSCMSDLLNKVIEQAFSEEGELKEILSQAKALITHLQFSGASMSLNHPLIDYAPARWNSIYHMLSSIEINWLDILNMMGESTNGFEKILHMNLHDFSSIVEILKQFFKCCSILEDETLPTLHLVIPIIHRLRKLCCSSSQNELVAKMKHKLKELLDELTNKHMRKLHKMAMYLFPPTNQLLQCTQIEKEETIEECKLLMKRYCPEESEHRKEQIRIKQELDDDDLFSDFVSFHTREDRIMREIRRYSDIQVPLDGYDVLRWWHENKDNFPLLHRISCTILSTPASGAASQEIFAKARNLLNYENHNQEITHKIIFLNKN